MRQVKGKSSNVTSAAYNNATNVLKVTYHGSGRPGRSYIYEDVSLSTYRAIVGQRSAGKAVWKRLRRAGVVGRQA